MASQGTLFAGILVLLFVYLLFLDNYLHCYIKYYITRENIFAVCISFMVIILVSCCNCCWKYFMGRRCWKWWLWVSNALENAVVVQLLSRVWLFVAAWTAAGQAPLSFTIFQRLLKLMCIEWVMLENAVVLALNDRWNQWQRVQFHKDTTRWRCSPSHGGSACETWLSPAAIWVIFCLEQNPRLPPGLTGPSPVPCNPFPPQPLEESFLWAALTS